MNTNKHELKRESIRAERKTDSFSADLSCPPFALRHERDDKKFRDPVKTPSITPVTGMKSVYLAPAHAAQRLSRFTQRLRPLRRGKVSSLRGCARSAEAKSVDLEARSINLVAKSDDLEAG